MGKITRIIAIILAHLVASTLTLAWLSNWEEGSRASSNVIYVNSSALGANNGTSWEDAYTNLQSALDVAEAGNEIWVAKGVYRPGGSGNRAATFQLKDGVTLYGGFAGTETDRGQRNWNVNLSVLSGDIGADDSADPNNVVTDTNRISGSNAYHVVTANGSAATAGLDGFTITAGQANGGSFPADCGGGMYVNNGSPTLTNLIFSANYATNGGGMANIGGSPSLSQMTFTNNTASYLGGGIYNQNANPLLNKVTFIGNSGPNGGGMYTESGHPTLLEVSFDGNSGYYGGGMYNYSSSPALAEVTFSNNSAGNHGGGMYNNSSSSPTLNKVDFTNNSATHYGGGMFNGNASNPVLENVAFFSNSAELGGGMYNDYSEPGIDKVTFKNNTASNAGGGMANRHSSPILKNIIFSDNRANSNGGGLYDSDSSPTLTNVTFFANTTGPGPDHNGGGIYNTGASRPIVVNAILWGNTAANGSQIYNDDGASIQITYSDVQGGWEGAGNINLNPLFVDAANRDLHLQPASHAVNSGTNTSCPPHDLDGNLRPFSTCDMGAYELVEVFLTKTVDNPTPVAGQVITFTIQVSSTGPILSGGLISDSLPAGLEFRGPLSLDPPGAGQVGTSPPTLATDLIVSANQAITVTLPVTVSRELAPGVTISNTAWFTSPELLRPVKGSAGLSLTGGNLSTYPTSLTFEVTTQAPTASQPLTLTNSGVTIANYEVFAIDDDGPAGYVIDCNSNLWAVDQTAQKVYPVASGEAGVYDWQTSFWLSTIPVTGSVANGGNAVLTVRVDAAGMPAGTYNGYLRIVNDTPYGDEIVPVALKVIEDYTLFLPLILR